MQNLAKPLNAAVQSINAGNLPLAELICRRILVVHGPQPEIYALLGVIARSVDLVEFAVEYFQQSLRLDQGNAIALRELPKAIADQDQKRSLAGKAARDRRQFLLIKAWGEGFWSDMDHVLGQLLVAELTGRIPVTHWGDNSRFGGQNGEDAFITFFEPVSSFRLSDLLTDDLSYFPPKWNRMNLEQNNINQKQGPYSRMAGLYLLRRDEDVVVSDYHNYVKDLIPWIPSGHWLHGMDSQTVYRRLFQKYIRPRKELAGEYEQYWREHLQPGPVLAVHVRGSDKFMEDDRLNEVNAAYHAYIAEYLRRAPELKIYLLTDSSTVLADYQQLYSKRLYFQECRRTDNATGVHYQIHPDRRRIGLEVMWDAFLAVYCDYFIGNARSNVSTAILHMKDWKSEDIKMFGRNILYEEPMYMFHA